MKNHRRTRNQRKHKAALGVFSGRNGPPSRLVHTKTGSGAFSSLSASEKPLFGLPRVVILDNGPILGRR